MELAPPPSSLTWILALAAACLGGCGEPQHSVSLSQTETTAAQGLPTSWYGYPLSAGPSTYDSLEGTVSVTNSGNVYSEVLFILEYLPAGACTSGPWPATTPEYGPPGAVPFTRLIVKAPSAGTYSVPVHFTLPGGVPIAGCLLLGLNGGTLGDAHDVTATSDLTLTYTGGQGPAQRLLGSGSEFCFGQSTGCQAATTDDTLSFASVQRITQPEKLVALFGDVSDSTFDGSFQFGAPPKGPWTATNDVFVYHGAECAALGADPASGIAGPADFYHEIPADAVHLLSVPIRGDDIGAQSVPVFAEPAEQLADGDCLVTLSGVQGSGAFDCEAQIIALVQ